MARLKLLLDTNIVVDCLAQREPFYSDARLLLIGGRVGEFDLCITASQMTDLIYILSDGGNKEKLPRVLEELRALRTFVDVFPIGKSETDSMLATSWGDPEDALIYDAGMKMKADFIITRNGSDFQGTLLKAIDCSAFFDWLEKTRGIAYREIEI